MTNLEKLNSLLQNNKIKIPEHTRQVHESGKNQQWLRKNLAKNPNPEVTPELLMLLAMPMSELAKTYVK